MRGAHSYEMKGGHAEERNCFSVEERARPRAERAPSNRTRARAPAPQLHATYLPEAFAATLWLGALTSANEKALSTLSYFLPLTST